MTRILSWFSNGAASAVATKLAIAEYGADVVPVLCETGSEHPDNERFAADCERWFGRPIVRIRSDEYADTWDVWDRRKYLAGVSGAPCTVELKVSPRLGFQRPGDVHVFGYTADLADMARASRLRETYFELSIRTPLIDKGLSKAATLAMLSRAGIVLPTMYGLGFANNNCIPCVKATSPAYWALVRKAFPDEFARISQLSRRLDVRLCRLAGDQRAFVDEIPEDHPTTGAIAPSCDFLCHIAESELADLPETAALSDPEANERQP